MRDAVVVVSRVAGLLLRGGWTRVNGERGEVLSLLLLLLLFESSVL